ncbi:MAG: response regulator [Elusimicrobiota bacterium]|jgi:DNA-binding response OmpR family regulator
MAKTVLVVDDDPFILLAVEKFLKMKGLNVICTEDPAEAHHLAETRKPDLVLSDISMPGIDGFTLLQSLRDNKATQMIPLALLTAKDKMGDVERGFSVGAQAYILKPIDWDRAWAKIQALLQ